MDNFARKVGSDRLKVGPSRFKKKVMNKEQRDRLHKLQEVGFYVTVTLASVVIVLNIVALIFKIVI